MPFNAPNDRRCLSPAVWLLLEGFRQLRSGAREPRLPVLYLVSLVTDPQLTTYRQLMRAKKIAASAYHAALAAGAADSIRHAAERQCATATAALETFVKAL